jgi:hypothetical protein
VRRQRAALWSFFERHARGAGVVHPTHACVVVQPRQRGVIHRQRLRPPPPKGLPCGHRYRQIRIITWPSGRNLTRLRCCQRSHRATAVATPNVPPGRLTGERQGA